MANSGGGSLCDCSARRRCEIVIRVLSVDDHVLLREGIAKLIGNQSDTELVAEASNTGTRLSNCSVSIVRISR
jgi:hypothetical protein